MNEQNNPSTDTHTTTSEKAAYKFMPAKKELPETDKLSDTGLPDAEDTPPETVVSNKPESSVRKKRAAITLNYAETFLHRYELCSRQGLHLEKETIATIKRIISSIGDERLTVSGFVENVLKHHFELYREEVNRLHDEKLRKPIE